MYLELIKTDFLTLDGSLTSFTLTPLKKPNGTNKVRADRTVDFKNTDENSDQIFGGHYVYNLKECNLETTITPPLTSFTMDSEKQSFSFEYRHMNIPLGSMYKGIAGRWNLILPEGWRLSELYVSDPYDREVDIEKKKQFKHEVLWDTQKNTHLIEMELLSKRGSFSFIVKGKALNISNNTDPAEINFIPCTESHLNFRTLNELNISHSKNMSILADFNKIIEINPSFLGVSVNINNLLDYLLTKWKSDRLKTAKREQRK